MSKEFEFKLKVIKIQLLYKTDTIHKWTINQKNHKTKWELWHYIRCFLFIRSFSRFCKRIFNTWTNVYLCKMCSIDDIDVAYTQKKIFCEPSHSNTTNFFTILSRKELSSFPRFCRCFDPLQPDREISCLALFLGRSRVKVPQIYYCWLFLRDPGNSWLQMVMGNMTKF